MEEFVAGVLQGTFSIAVAGYLLVRMEKRLDDLTTAITRLESAINGLFQRGGDV
ncbi:MAG: YvrJ family protein [Synergistaceae bacterium]|jgi:hypothetical protein|nr:YvrJ family protein [Synergistaceae bacterium]